MAESNSPENPETISNSSITDLNESSAYHETIIKGSDESFEMYCETCNRDGERRTAEAFCTTCTTYLCLTCLKYHGKFLTGHTYLKGKNMPQDICMEKCQTQVNEIIKFYCEQCKKVVCFLCKKEEHTEICTMKYLPDLLKDIETADEFNELKANKIQIEKQLLDASTEIETRHKRIRSIVEEASSSVQKVKDALFSMFDDDVSKMVDKIQSLETKDDSRVSLVKDHIESVVRESNLISENIKKMSCLPKSQGYKSFLNLKQKTCDLEKIKGYIESLKKDCCNNVDALEEDLKLQIKDLAENITELDSLASQDRDVEQVVANEYIQAACFEDEINIRANGDANDCVIVDCCLLSKLYLVACDRANCSLKLIDINRKESIYVRPVKTYPVAVSSVSETQIVMSQPFERNTDKSIIQFLTVTATNQLKFLKRSFLTEMFCCDIAYVRNDRLVISMSLNDNGKVQILTMNGEVMNNIEYDEEGDKLFRCPYAITGDAKQERFYVSDWYNDSITEIDTRTQQTREILHSFWHPVGITMCSEHNVCVFEEGAGRVHILDLIDSSSYVLLKEQWDPLSICFSLTDDKLYLGQSDVIKIYNISSGQMAKKAISDNST